MKLYTFFRSSAAYRVRIALNLKGLPYESVPIHLRRGGGEHRRQDYLDRNPQGLIPALEIDGSVISQSLAIVEYLDERWPEPRLLPTEPLAKAHVRGMSLLVACDIHPLNNLRVLNYLRGELKQSEENTNTWYRHWVAEGLRALEIEASHYSSDKRYCYGAQVSLADICLVPQIYNARRFSCDLTPYPTLSAITKHLESIPAFQAAVPESQPDAE